MIDPLITNPKQDNDLQLARTASIPANEKYHAKEWNAIVDKINEIISDLSLGQITDSVTKTTATNIVRLVEGALIETNLTIRDLPEATTEQKMILLNSLGEAALADISDFGGELKKIGDGYGLQHQVDNPTYYGTLGEYAVNLSYNEQEGDYGATGGYSHAEGLATTASGQYSHAEGFYSTASGNYSHAEGGDTIASGEYSHAEGRATTAGSFAENARGVHNEIITPISTNSFDSNDVIESVGVGATNVARKNALTRWKNGAFKWLLQPLTNITNAVIGFHAADETGRLNYHNGTEWKKYALEGEGGGGNGVTPTITENVITNYDIDPQLETEHWNIVMTGDTDFGFTNMFATDNSKVITITLKGDYAFQFPIWLKPLETNDDYDTIEGSAEIVINIKNGGTTPTGYYSLQMIDYGI